MKKTLSKLSISEAKLEPTLQAFTDLNFVLNPDGEIMDYTLGFLLQEGLTGSVSHQKIQDILPADLTAQIEHALLTIREAGNSHAIEYCMNISGQDHWFNARFIPLSTSQVIFTSHDITQCKETEHRLKRQMQQLTLLRSIDLAIASGLDLNLLLAMLLDQVSALMQVDAVSILLHNPRNNLLEFTAGRGFRSSSLQHTRLRPGEGCAGRVVLERKMVHIPDLRENHVDFDRSPHFREERFVTYYGIPLIAKGRVLGVLEFFHRDPLRPDADWLDFLHTIAGQAAIAIDNAIMFKDLQRSNLELSIAYDATIEGLSRALDLRDRETEEHTQRVTDLTVKLALRLGVDTAEIIHLRRGAVLHDIGKVAIPDHILFKPGPLEDEEWQIMRRHPGIAVDLLAPVTYLAPALDIPHWHHEKWDGSGYPDRLGGEEIPFPARLFALVDVYDALTSNRPYRGPWSKDDTIRYITDQSGKHFDPRIVPEFLNMVRTYPN